MRPKIIISIIIILIIFLLMLLSSSIKIMAEYQRIVIFRLGRLLGIKGPGLVFIVPVIDKIIKLAEDGTLEKLDN